MSHQFRASSSPHIRQPQTLPRIMIDVCLACLPSALFGVFRFGLYSAFVLVFAVAGTVLTEWIGNRVMNRPSSLDDFSAVVTGLLLGMCCPPYVPLWLPFLGGVFAIAVVKLPFGGLGHNFLNPALTARAVLLASWPALMTQWTQVDALASATVDTMASATPLIAYKLGMPASYGDLLVGNVMGSIGEVCKIALLIGAAYLVIRRIINLNTPVGYLLGLFVFSWLFGGPSGLFSGDGLYAVLSGGALMGACFMCNDYSTSPVTPIGQFVMGLGAGILTALIRIYGTYAEGVTYAILFMNVLTPLIDRFIRPKAFGEGKV